MAWNKKIDYFLKLKPYIATYKKNQGRIQGQYQLRMGGQGCFHIFRLVVTDRRTDGQTGKGSYRVARPEIKKSIISWSWNHILRLIKKIKAGYKANTSCGWVGRGVFTFFDSWSQTDGRMDRRTKALIELRVLKKKIDYFLKLKPYIATYKKNQGRIQGQYQLRIGGQGCFHIFRLVVTDRRTDGRTDKGSYRVACPQLKRELYEDW